MTTPEQMEKYCRELMEELSSESHLDSELTPIISSLKALNQAYEILPEIQTIDRNLVYYWIQDEAKKLSGKSIEEIADIQEGHKKRQRALEELIAFETIRSKTKESTTYLLINKMMRGMTDDQKKKMDRHLKKRVKAQGKAPKTRTPAATKTERAVLKLRELGYTDEQIKGMV